MNKKTRIGKFALAALFAIMLIFPACGCSGPAKTGGNPGQTANQTSPPPAASATPAPTPAQTPAAEVHDKAGSAAITNELSSKVSTDANNDPNIVISTIELFFYAMERDYRADENFDFSVFFAGDDNTDRQYFCDKQAYKKALNKKSGVIPESQSIGYTMSDFKIDAASATVTLKVDYTFEYNDGQDALSGMSDMYTIDFVKNDAGQWRITKIKTTDEFDQNYYETGFDLEQLLAEQVQ